MKRTRKILMILILAIITICMVNGERVFAYTVLPLYRVELIHNDGKTDQYENVQQAIDAAKDGETVKALLQTSKDITISNKNITYDFNKQNSDFKTTITGGSEVKFINAPNSSYAPKGFIIEDNCKVTFSGSVYGGFSQTSSAPKVVLKSNSTVIFDDGVDFYGSCAVKVEGSNSNVIIKNGAKVTGGRDAIIVDEGKSNNTINVEEGGYLKAYSSGIPAINDTGSNTTFNVKGEIEGTIELQGNGSTLNIEDGANVHNLFDWAVKLEGEDNSIEVKKGTIKGGFGGILADSNSSTINIDGGTVEGCGRSSSSYPNLVSPGIFANDIKELNMNSGNITGELGILAYNGDININGGEVSATNNDEEKHHVYYGLRDGAGDYPECNGSAVIVDNNNNSNAKVTVNGGTFNSETDKLFGSAGEKADNYDINGGTFKKPIDGDYVTNGTPEIAKKTSDGTTTYYVGEDAEEAVKSAEKGDEVDVLQGNLTIPEIKEGVSLKNSGSGDVDVNGTKVGNEPITTININNAIINGLVSKTYTGNLITQNITVKVNDKLLVLNKDYTIDYQNNVNKGTATVIIKGKGIYVGNKTATFTISSKNLGKANVSGITNKTYTRKSLTQNIKVILDGKTLINGKDYSIDYKNNINPGKATIIINGKGNYTGTITKTFNISISKVSVSVKKQTKTTITIKWNKSTGVNGYYIYRATSKNGKYKKIKTVKKDSTTTYKDTKLKTGKVYYYKVRPYVTINKKNQYAEYSKVFATSTKTKTPTLTVSKGRKKATLKWKKVSGATGYEVYMKTGKKGKYKKVKTVTKSKTVKYTKKSLKKGKTYYFKIRTYKTISGKKVYSYYSKIKLTKITK